MYSYAHALLFALGFALTSAIESPVYITVPPKVAAGNSLEAVLNADVHNGDPGYANAFRVYLGASYDENKNPAFVSSDCYLIHEQTLCDATIDINSDSVNYQNTKFNVTIPANVGPSGKHYVLTAQTLNTDGSFYGASLESDIFELIGANGTWSPYQKDGYTLWGDDGIPCSAFTCVKQCAGDSSFARPAPSGSNSTHNECINACPSVSVDESYTRGGQPTAALTTPSPCPSSRSLSATEATTTGEPTATRSRSATAAAGTSAAGSMRVGRRILLTGFIMVATVFIIN